MGWDDNESKNNKNKGSGKNQPPDLDEALKRIQQKIKKAFSGGGGGFSPGSKSGSSLGKSGGLFGAFLALVALVLWFLSGIFIVDPAEQAAILRFGRYIETVGPGPHWIPRFIESKVVVNVDRVADYSYSAQMLTKDENLVSVSLAVQYRINDLKAYLFNVSDPDESLRQATSSALRQVVGTTTLDALITEGREAWGIHVHDSLVKVLAPYKTGIVILSVSPQPARAPEHVQDAFDDAIKAQEDEKRFKEQAYAYRAREIPLAQGHAKRILAEAKAFSGQVVFHAKGDVAEFLALLPQYLKAPQVMAERMYFDTLQSVLARTPKVVVQTPSNNLLYLPLDKLMKTKPASQKSLSSLPPMRLSKLSHTDSIPKTYPDTRIVDRVITRPIDRSERNF